MRGFRAGRRRTFAGRGRFRAPPLTEAARGAAEAEDSRRRSGGSSPCFRIRRLPCGRLEARLAADPWGSPSRATQDSDTGNSEAIPCGEASGPFKLSGFRGRPLRRRPVCLLRSPGSVIMRMWSGFGANRKCAAISSAAAFLPGRRTRSRAANALRARGFRFFGAPVLAIPAIAEHGNADIQTGGAGSAVLPRAA